mgnify:CR=1 FL=1
MDRVTPATFWGAVTIVASAIGGLFFLSVSHSSEPKHPDSALETDVSKIELKLEGVATDVVHHTAMLKDLKTDLKELRVEQMDQGREILEAIRNGN